MPANYYSTAVSFTLGEIVITQGIQALLDGRPEALLRPLLLRHENGDWGECDIEDKKANDVATRRGGRIVSVYRFSGQRVWLITEAGHQLTTVLLRSEY
ncbi:type I restriction endonuclease subunit M [Vibrio brasiliensis]|uniref:type I restriction endonuclease subunit M n=1 Tax=Vibrio brasiliensis TaxID=170652 RepID=UPI001EFDCD17|nr:type I restriction endonuclease subunit M [Vibrio brasiliensis]MCG9753285.1 type I restriction endonuclease subunit M [Vibrio brasiliensis]